MTATNDSGNGHGSKWFQETFDELKYPNKASENIANVSKKVPPLYRPSPKHDPKFGWGSENPIKSQEEGQKLLDTGYKSGRQIYNVASNGDIIKFQPDGTPENGYHAYKVKSQQDIPHKVLKAMEKDGKLSKNQFNKKRKGK